MSETIHWAIVLLAGSFIVGNWRLMLEARRTGKGTSLILPFVAGPIGALACLNSPSPFLQKWFWIPLAADITLWLVLPLLLVGALVACFRRSGRSDGNAKQPSERADGGHLESDGVRDASR